MMLFTKAGIAFVPVPKNAGKSISPVLRDMLERDMAPTARDFGISVPEFLEQFAPGKGVVHPELGLVKQEHLPLVYWRDHFPHSWASFGTLKSFALVREPRDRFFSAVLQRLGEFKDVKGLRADDPQVQEEALRVSEWLAGRGKFHDPEYIHFIRQVDFVDLDGQRMVDRVFLMRDTSTLVQQWVREQTGVPVDFALAHTRREPKGWAAKVQPVARFVGRKLMPRAIKRAIYPLWMNSGAFANAAARYGEIALNPDVERFIAEYYAADAALFAEAGGAQLQRSA